MNKLIASPRAPFVVSIVIGWGLVGGGVVLAQTLNLAACPLCILQRMLYLLVGALACCGLVASGALRRLVACVMAAAAATGAWVAGYQIWIQRFAQETNCTADAPWWERLVDWAGERVPLLFGATGLCNERPWKLLGLSIAEWSLLAFATLLALALFAAVRRTRDASSF